MRLRTAILAWVGMGVSGCGAAGDPVAEHEMQWAESRPPTYVAEVCATGFAFGCTRVAVTGEKVIAARRGEARDLQFVDPATIEEPMGRLFRAVRESRCTVKNVSFDERFGYVTEYYQDCGEEGDGEKVTCFVPASVDLAVCAK
jgi:hypothetical protein